MICTNTSIRSSQIRTLKKIRLGFENPRDEEEMLGDNCEFVEDEGVLVLRGAAFVEMGDDECWGRVFKGVEGFGGGVGFLWFWLVGQRG